MFLNYFPSFRGMRMLISKIKKIIANSREEEFLVSELATTLLHCSIYAIIGLFFPGKSLEWFHKKFAISSKTEPCLGPRQAFMVACQAFMMEIFARINFVKSDFVKLVMIKGSLNVCGSVRVTRKREHLKNKQ